MIKKLQLYDINLLYVILAFLSLFFYTLFYHYWSNYNYLFLSVSFFIFLNYLIKNRGIEIFRPILLIYVFFIIILSLPLLYSNSYYARGVTNQYFFIFISFTVCLIYLTIKINKKSEFYFIERKFSFNIIFDKIVFFTLLAVFVFYLLCIVYLNIFHYPIINIFFYIEGDNKILVFPFSWQFKSNYDFYLQGLDFFDFKKQEIGNSMFFFFSLLIVSKINKYLKFLIGIIVFLLLCVSIRQLILSAVVFYFLFYFSSLIHNKKTNILIILIALFVFLALIILRYFDTYLDINSLSNNDPRVSILNNTVSALKNNVLGGGFQSYQHLFMTSSESDVVSILLNFGIIFGSIFYAIHLILLFNFVNFYKNVNVFDKFIFIYFGLFIFSGIGEDNMFRLTHWIATGLFLTSYFFNKNKNEEISKKI